MAGSDWHTFHPDDYFCGDSPLKLRVLRVLRLEPAPPGWVVVEGVEYDWRGEPVDRERRATVRVAALRAAGVPV